jgi:hypothetical protein
MLAYEPLLNFNHEEICTPFHCLFLLHFLLYHSPHNTGKIKPWTMKWTHLGEMRNMCKIFVGYPEGKRL